MNEKQRAGNKTTARKKQEEANDVAGKYELLFNSIDQGFCVIEIIWDENNEPADYRFLEVNAAFERQTGIKDATGRTMKEIEPRHEEHWFHTFGNVARTGTPLHFEQKAEYLINGWYEFYAFPIENGQNFKVGVLFNDITPRKHIEAAMQASEEQKTFMLQLSDELRPLANAGEIQYAVTSKTMNFFKADRCYYCEIENDLAIIRQEARKDGLPPVTGSYSLSSLPVLQSVIDAGGPFVVEDVNTTDLVDESLKEICIRLQVISFIDVPVIKNGKAVGILCIVQCTPRQWTEFEIALAQETTERAWAAVDRARVEREKEELMRHKQEFIGIASHELKTPLTSIKAYTELLLEMLEPGDKTEYKQMTAKLNAQVDRLANLVMALLDITKIEEGKLVLQPQTVDLDELVRERTTELQHTTTRHRLIFIPGNIPKIIADYERIGQVLTNLLSNAIKYSPAGGGIIVTTSLHDQYVQVSVRDRGIGIPAGEQEKIFERFFRHPEWDAYQGMGLGLYISAGIIARHAGTITVDSKEGKGSEFIFTLPL